eukprot:GILI01005948.1.p1 GENE.GILI01005948.1~~GILI01005948.1.p1  ORF type:complete len:230 (-),score=30.42 GILI01005948.1:186-818(-)
MPLLPSTDSLSEVLLCSNYFITSAITIVCTFGINFGIVYASNKDYPEKWVVFDVNVAISLIILHLIMPVIVFFGTGGTRARIIAGKQRPLSQSALCDTMILRTLFFSLAVPNWKSRLLRFVGNAFLVPLLPIAFILAFACWADLGFCSITSDQKCSLTLYGFVSLDASWKTAGAMILHTMNYLSAHNDAQPELYENEEEEKASLKNANIA